MKTKLQEILNSLYEAEGLLEMALRRGESYYAPLAGLARDKCFHIADLAATLEILEHEVTNDIKSGDSGAGVDDAEKVFVDKIVPKLDAELADATEKEFEAMADETPEPDVHTHSLPDEKTNTDDDSGDTNESPAEEVENLERVAEKPMYHDAIGDSEIADASIFEEEEDAGETPADEPDPEQIPATPDVPKDAVARSEIMTPSIFSDEEIDSEVADDDKESHEDDAEADDIDDSEEMDDDYEEESVAPPMRILNRKPIATFFSINDKFRFRRELFGNSTPEWLDTLALLETMQDIDEAKDYLFDDLQWVADSPEVKAFIEVITRYYNS